MQNKEVVLKVLKEEGKGTQKVLCVGLLCLDIVCVCQEYPIEDTDQRCLDQQWRRGGNAANTATVLKGLGSPVEYLGVIMGQQGRELCEDLRTGGVDIGNCVWEAETPTPTSCIILSASTGSRTIMHFNRGLKEVPLQHFSSVHLSPYSWIHFEGRNYPTVKEMIERVRDWRRQAKGGYPKISLEMEKTKPQETFQGLLSCVSLVDLLFVSSTVSQALGFSSKEQAVKHFKSLIHPTAVVICAWGKDGACGSAGEGSEVLSVPAVSPDKVIDTLGAGDTFNAATLFALARGFSLREVLEFACTVAGVKCGTYGVNEILNALSRQLQFTGL